jgi:hypothetical protein
MIKVGDNGELLITGTNLKSKPNRFLKPVRFLIAGSETSAAIY